MIRHASAVVIAVLCNSIPLLAQNAGTPIAQIVVKATADVYRFPSTASPVIGKALGGTVLDIRRNLGSWVEVGWPMTASGIAFVHVNTGTITPLSTPVASNEARAAVAQIAAVAAAATAAGSANAGSRSNRPMPTLQGSPHAAYVSLPQHRIGMGALMNASKPRFGATARTWWGHRLGAQFSVSRPQLENADGHLMTSTQLAPSILYSLPDGVTNGLWLRPYLGAGPRFYRANLQTRPGYDAFGGAEATLAAMPQFALSADLEYRWSRPSIDGFGARQVGFSLSGHWYVK